MPIPVQCPQCGKRLRAPDAAAGRRIKCTGCQTVVPVPEAQLEPGWQTVRTGLRMAGWGVIVSAICALAARFPLAHGTILILFALAMAGGLLYLMGSCMCLTVPTDSGLKGLAVATVVCTLLGPVGVVVFVVFLRRVARYFHNDELARQLVSFLVKAGLMMMCAIGWTIAASFLAGNEIVYWVDIGVNFVLTLALLIVMFWFGRLLREARQTIALERLQEQPVD